MLSPAGQRSTSGAGPETAPVKIGDSPQRAVGRSRAAGGGGGCSAVAFQEQPTSPLRLFRLAAADGSRSGQKMASGRHLTAVHALVPAGMSRPASIFRSMVLMDAE